MVNLQHFVAVLSKTQAHNKGTVASKKKKKAKLQRAIRSMKRQQRLSSENNNSNYYSPFNHLKDAQVFVLSYNLLSVVLQTLSIFMWDKEILGFHFACRGLLRGYFLAFRLAMNVLR